MSAELARLPALTGYGHFTMMQVRGGRTRGLALHLTRLSGAHRELFDAELDGALVCRYIRHALDGRADATVRVQVYGPAGSALAGEPIVVVTVRSAAEPPAAAQRLRSEQYLRPAAHLKHVGGFGQTYYARRAERAGFDDALLVGTGGLIAETTIANFGLFDGQAVVWPAAPQLVGITMQLVAPRLGRVGLGSERREVRLAELGSFRSAFITNSIGIAPVRQIDDVELPVDPDLMSALGSVYQSVPWDPI